MLSASAHSQICSKLENERLGVSRLSAVTDAKRARLTINCNATGCFPVHRMGPANISRPTIACHVLDTLMFLARSPIVLSA